MSSSLKRDESPIPYFLLFLGVSLFAIFFLELCDDEAYYWSWSLRPALSYFDHPPLQAWITWLTTYIFGKTNFAVRLPAFLSILATARLWMAWARRENLQPKFPLWILLSSPIFFVFSWMALPDVYFIPLALAAILAFDQEKFLACGFYLGLALLAKWHAALLVPGFCFAILANGTSYRVKLKQIASIGFVSALFQAPVLVWNYQHHWAAIRFHLLERHTSHPHSLVQALGNGLGFLGGFLGIAGSGFIFLVVCFAIRFWRGQIKFHRREIPLLVWSLCYVGVFFLSAVNGENRIYWAAFGIFPLSLILYKGISESQERMLHLISKCTFGLLATVFLLVGFFPVGAYIRPAVELFRDYDLRMSPRGDLIGWQPWIKNELQKNPQALYLASDFRLASQILWNSALTLEQVYSIDNYHQYAIWPAPNSKAFDKAVFFGDNRRKLDFSDFHKICNQPLVDREVMNINLRGQVVKIISSTTCSDINYLGYQEVFPNEAIRD